MTTNSATTIALTIISTVNYLLVVRGLTMWGHHGKILSTQNKYKIIIVKIISNKNYSMCR